MKLFSEIKQRMSNFYFMIMITFVFVSIISTIYNISKPVIKKNETFSLKKSILSTIINPLSKNADINQLFNQYVMINPENENQYFAKKPKDPAHQLNIIIQEGEGLWGAIKCAVAFDEIKETIHGFSVIEQVETPGLGAKIEEQWFKDQFIGKKAPLTPVAYGSQTTDQQFESITGATITTNAIKTILNEAYKKR